MLNFKIPALLVFIIMLSACGGSAVISNDLDPSSHSLANLGKELFFDTLLSLDHTVSCASCHKPEHGFADDAALSVGVGGKPLSRHTPHLFNLADGSSFFWDGRARSLEEQALMPIQDPDEMGLELSTLVERLEAHPLYPDSFFRAPPPWRRARTYPIAMRCWRGSTRGGRSPASPRRRRWEGS